MNLQSPLIRRILKMTHEWVVLGRSLMLLTGSFVVIITLQFNGLNASRFAVLTQAYSQSNEKQRRKFLGDHL